LFREAIPQVKVGYIRVTHPCATLMESKLSNPVRLACIRPAASVHPEPGSNSPLYNVSFDYSLTLLSSFWNSNRICFRLLNLYLHKPSNYSPLYLFSSF